MKVTKESVLEALKRVGDPITGVNIVDRNMVGKVDVDGKNVTVFITVNQGASEDVKFEMITNATEAIKSISRWVKVNIHLEQNMNLSKKDGGPLDHIKNIIAVASGKGGVGKSTVATNLALALKKAGHRVGMIDADLYGPSVPTMFGLEGHQPKVTKYYGKDRIIPLIGYDMPVMSIGFIVPPEQAVVLRGPRLATILTQFFNDVLWPALDFLIIDLPPGTGDIHLTMVQNVPVTGAIMVTTPQTVAVIDAVKAMNMFRLDSVKVPILGVVENMAWFTPKELPNNKYYIFGEGGGEKLASVAHTKLLAQIPIVQGIREGGDKGVPAVVSDDDILTKTFMDLAQSVVHEVELRNQNQSPTKVVEVQ